MNFVNLQMVFRCLKAITSVLQSQTVSYKSTITYNWPPYIYGILFLLVTIFSYKAMLNLYV